MNILTIILDNHGKYEIEKHNRHRCIIKACSLFILTTTLGSIVAQSRDDDASSSSTETISYRRSAQGLRHLIYADLQIAKVIKQKIFKLPYVNQHLRNASEKYLKDLYSGSGLKTKNNFTHAQARVLAGNPIASYRTMRRMFRLLYDVVYHVQGFLEFPGKRVTKYLFRGLPNQIDVDEAMDGILILHLFNDFDIEQFSEGLISGVRTGAKLDAIHCYEIGEFALKYVHKFDHAVNWLQVALKKVTRKGDRTIEADVITSLFNEAVKKHDEVFKITNGTGFFSFTEPVEPMLQHGNFSNRQTKRNFEYKAYLESRIDNNNRSYNYYDFISLCGGDNLQTLEDKSKLFCWLEFNKHPKFLIGPMKMEFLARNPDVVQIYDVIGDKMIRKVKKSTAPEMVPALVMGGDPRVISDSVSDHGRISETAFLNDTTKVFRPISQTISHLTGLDTKTNSDFIQVASYTFSGLYEPHYDAMTDVEKGGGTAFPFLGLAVKPIKRSAVFWYSILPSAKRDNLTFHGACPVILGQKYVATKWVRYFEQFATSKCPKDPEERFTVLVNSKKSNHPSIAIEADKVSTPHHSTAESISPINPERKDVTNSDSSTALPIYSYRSVPSLKSLTQTEFQIYKIMKAAFMHSLQNISQMSFEIDESLEKNNSCVETYIKDFEETSGKLLISNLVEEKTKWEMVLVENVTSNPIAIFRMIWRFENFIKKWTSNNLPLSQSYQGAIQGIKVIYNASEGPEPVDLEEATIALLKIQYVYDLEAKDMASGLLAGRLAFVTLSALQCYEIAMTGIRQEMFTLGIEWLEAALLKVMLNMDTSITQEKVERGLEEAKEVHDKAHVRTGGWYPVFYNKRFNDPTELDFQKRITRKELLYNAYRFQPDSVYAEINFNGICSGKVHQTPREKSKLFCWYESEIHPFWKINPIKAEFHSLRPKLEIVQYYDLLSDSIMEKLKESVVPKLGKSSTATGKLEHSSSLRSTDSRIRSSVNAWVKESENEDAWKISKLVERVTGLVAKSPPRDHLQIGSYAAGAHYNAHIDENRGIGEFNTGRIATFMFYLSDVQLGGHTAFCQAGASVAPRKGSAVFWNNYFDSGEPNNLTWHGACPVIFGEKWVANKWLSYGMQKHKVCQGDRTTVDEILVNGKSKYI